MKVAIIGCGLIGRKRALNLGNDKLLYACDVDIKKAKKLAEEFSARPITDFKTALLDKNIDIVIVSTINKYLAPIAIEAVKKNKHILVEKPAATSLSEIKKLQSVLKKHKVAVKIGFNHRFHPAIQKALEIIEKENVGEVLYIRARYGHGGRPGYDKEWRAKKELSGGGELLDQGVHIIDLSRMFFNEEFKFITGSLSTYFWDMDMEDNCFMLLKTKSGKTAFLHTSWTEWKNKFSFEVFFRYAKLEITGLGGSYGPEKLTYFRMKKEMGVPDIFTYEFPGEDISWKEEYKNFCEAIEKKILPFGNITDAVETLKVVARIYKRR